MNSRIKKIVLLTAALMFLATGVSFAHDRQTNPNGHAYGNNKQKWHPVWHKKHPVAKYRHPQKYAPRRNKGHHRDKDHDKDRRGHNGSFVKLFVADQNVAFKIVVKNRR